ncbi:Uncharacterized protein BP5553_09387 [Venustampulla echinocandica]|uniref:RNA polymerase II subunit B1 CTD phosphatase RPAP2 homolog n=1 Tax=Venustampulla echinocandica TaxID=2656787 RepID=A0A370TCM9_9HELO|nr:Uncharacterized protein BP5553_09387 [Venustampulla echinocandica]RDL31985.1 Uncharacterized protein BP5553_09387 [Venustampulla echinocandica]
MTTPKMPVSILKKATNPATNSSSNSRDDRNRALALHHAGLIQQRKDIELEILLSMETLMDYPLATFPYNASNPSPEDAKTFKDLLWPFQPSDYDALLVERNINGHCGYTLCPNPRLKEEGGGKYRVIYKSGKAKDFKVVEKEELEKWCSEDCARRALYVRVQLSETPAWERGAFQSLGRIDLLDEPKSDDVVVMDGIAQMQLGGEERDRQQKTANLALERGDRGTAAQSGLVDVRIQENQVQGNAQPPSLDIDNGDLSRRLDDMHLALEGHIPTFGTGRQISQDEEDTDWKL